ncbi:MAG: hypothetical protein KDE04_15775, partial [Anaerolineales bacterium]|nr:hypothetical protein [Anaerolineales bacterium]
MSITTNETIRTVELAEHIGEHVRLRGWLHAIRRLGGINFLLLRDGWGIAQAVISEESALAPLQAAGAGAESIIALEGEVVASEQAPAGVELHNPQITLLNAVTETLPAAMHKRALKTSLPTLLDHAVVLNRHPSRRAIFRLAAAVMAGFRQTLLMKHFTEVQTPKIVASATEGGANVFPVSYFAQTAYL